MEIDSETELTRPEAGPHSCQTALGIHDPAKPSCPKDLGSPEYASPSKCYEESDDSGLIDPFVTHHVAMRNHPYETESPLTIDQAEAAKFYAPNPIAKRLIEETLKLKAKPWGGPQPITDMIVEVPGGQQFKVTVLIDSGCTTPIMSTTFIKQNDLPYIRRSSPLVIEDLAGDAIKGAGELYTPPFLLQHKRYWTAELFESCVCEKGIDVVLPW